jgi:hypothetical protein
MRALLTALLVVGCLLSASGGQRYTAADGKLRIALAQQPFSPTGTSPGPKTMANGGIQQQLTALGATIRLDEAALSGDENTEYGGWKRLGMALGHFADIVAKNERDGYFTVGLYATCPSMPGMVAGLQHSGPTREPIRVGMLWLDATRTSTRRRRRAADRSAACRWRSPRGVRCRECASMRISIRRCPTRTS